jgi:putative ABC transport system ATP-binding protein
MALFDTLQKEGNTIILVTHEEYIAEHTDRIIRLRDGNIESDQAVQNKRVAVTTA